MKSAHFWIVLTGSVAFCLWLSFGLGSDLRLLQGAGDFNSETGFRAMALNSQNATTVAVQDLRSAVTWLAGYIAFVTVVISHKYLWQRSDK